MDRGAIFGGAGCRFAQGSKKKASSMAAVWDYPEFDGRSRERHAGQ